MTVRGGSPTLLDSQEERLLWIGNYTQCGCERRPFWKNPEKKREKHDGYPPSDSYGVLWRWYWQYFNMHCSDIASKGMVFSFILQGKCLYICYILCVLVFECLSVYSQSDGKIEMAIEFISRWCYQGNCQNLTLHLQNKNVTQKQWNTLFVYGK